MFVVTVIHSDKSVATFEEPDIDGVELIVGTLKETDFTLCCIRKEEV